MRSSVLRSTGVCRRYARQYIKLKKTINARMDGRVYLIVLPSRGTVYTYGNIGLLLMPLVMILMKISSAIHEIQFVSSLYYRPRGAPTSYNTACHIIPVPYTRMHARRLQKGLRHVPSSINLFAEQMNLHGANSAKTGTYTYIALGTCREHAYCIVKIHNTLPS